MGLSVIHFSDIHIKNENDTFFKKTGVIKNACVNAIPSTDNVIVAISGDIAFSGQKEQYDLAKTFLNDVDSMLSKRGVKNISYVLVPGNHDCDFCKKSSVRESLISSATYDSVDEEIYSQVSNVQENYFAFSQAISGQSKEMFQISEIEVGNKKVAFISINTAWMSLLHENYGSIEIPEKFLKKISRKKYAAVFGMYHHPSNWLTEESRIHFDKYVNESADILLVGHEHYRSEFRCISNTSSVHYYKAKELQDNSDEKTSAFSILRLDDDFCNITCKEFVWDGLTYAISERKETFERNKSIVSNEFEPNERARKWVNDIGFTVNHFAKEDVSLLDLFVWPDIKKYTHHSEKRTSVKIRTDADKEILASDISLVFGPYTVGKTSIAKMLYMSIVLSGKTCIYLTGNDLRTSDRESIEKAIDRAFSEQYTEKQKDEFRNYPRDKKAILIDDFDTIAMIGNRRSEIVDTLFDLFGKVIIFVSSELEVASTLMANSITRQDSIFSFEVLPLGNTKRRELVNRWYRIAENDKSEEDIENRVDKGIELLNKFLGNGAGFIPAYPIYLINALQNIDAANTNSESKYGFLYESMIQKSLAKVSEEYRDIGAYNVDIEAVSCLAFDMLVRQKTTFSEEDFQSVIDSFNEKKMLKISRNETQRRMMAANVFSEEQSEGNVYRFKYPYIFYFFAGHYIAYNSKEEKVLKMIEHMSENLYIEAYGNIMIFVCHFSNNTDVIDTILINAYDTLGKYPVFDYFEKNDRNELAEAIPMVAKNTVGSNEDVSVNRKKRLQKLDDLGVNDGTVSDTGFEMKDDEEDYSEFEKDMASISAALKTMDVLGQIIQNYPGGIEAQKKTEIIQEIYRLGMRAIEAISENLNGLQDEWAEFVFERAQLENKSVTRDGCKHIAKKIINMLALGLLRGMVNKIAVSINSTFLGVAAKNVLNAENSVFADLVLADLQLNCFKQPNFGAIEDLKERIEKNNDTTSLVAKGVLNQIVVNYLDYNKCDYKLRQKLCALFSLTDKHKHPQLENLQID